MLSRAAFEEKLAPLRAVAEARRLHYRRYFYIGVAIGTSLLGASLFVPTQILEGIEGLFGLHNPLKSSDITGFRLFSLVLAILFILGPVFNYRGENGFSIERALLDRLLSFFGNLIALPAGAITGADFRRAGLSPGAMHVWTGEGAAGTVGDARLRLCALSCYNPDSGILVFHGIALWRERLESESSAPLLSAQPPAFLQKTLEEAVLHLKAIAIVSRWDEQLYNKAVHLYRHAREWIVDRMGKNELPSEKAYRKQHEIPKRLFALPHTASSDPRYAPFVLEQNAQSSLVLLPDLPSCFQLGSLFEPALGHPSTERFYNLMHIAWLLGESGS